MASPVLAPPFEIFFGKMALPVGPPQGRGGGATIFGSSPTVKKDSGSVGAPLVEPFATLPFGRAPAEATIGAGAGAKKRALNLAVCLQFSICGVVSPVRTRASRCYVSPPYTTSHIYGHTHLVSPYCSWSPTVDLHTIQHRNCLVVVFFFPRTHTPV